MVWVVVLGALGMLTGCGKQIYRPKHLEHVAPEHAHCAVTKDKVSVYARTLSSEDKKYYFEPTILHSSPIKVVQLTIANQRESAVAIHRKELDLSLYSKKQLMKKFGFSYGPQIAKVGLGFGLLVVSGVVWLTLLSGPWRDPFPFWVGTLWVAADIGGCSLLSVGLGGYCDALHVNTAFRSDLRVKMLPKTAVIPANNIESYLLFCDEANKKSIFPLTIYDQEQLEQQTIFTIDLSQQESCA